MDRVTATRLIATLISVTQSGSLTWKKQPPGKILDKDHAVSAVYFTEMHDIGFRIYRYKWERSDYSTIYDAVAFAIQPRRARGVILELVDDDGSLIESIQDVSALGDLFDVVNRHVSNINEKIERILGYSNVSVEQETTTGVEEQK